MKKQLATLCCALLAFGGLRAQNTALQFDGQDDFAFVTVNNPPATITTEGFTFEAIFKAIPNGHDMVLLSAPQANGDLLFGIDINGAPFTSYRGNNYVGETPFLADNECHHIAITFTDRDVKFYADGQYSNTETLNAQIDFTNQTNMYLGMNYPDQNTAFQGVLDEVRLWPEVRTDNDIASFATSTPNISQWPRYLILSFWEGQGTTTYDPFETPYSLAHWLVSEGADMEWTENCLPNETYYARVGTNPLPPCIPNSGITGNLICNGDFEQYDTILNIPMAGYPSSAPFTTVSGSSDVVNWLNYGPSLLLNPDFFVRGGIGGIPATAWNLGGWKTEVWDAPNLNNRAMAGLYSNYDLSFNLLEYNEAIITTLTSPALGGMTYKFNGWFKTGKLNDSLAPNFTHNLHILLSTSGQPVYTAIPSVQLTNHNTLTSSNGWEYVTIIFTLPAGVNYTKLIVRAETPGTYWNPVHSYLDNLSLVPFVDNFPQHIQTSYGNDSFHRRIKTDANKNVYVTGKVSNSPQNVEFGLPIPSVLSVTNADISSYIVKYDSLGSLLWHKSYSGFEINDFEIMPNGNLFAVGVTNISPLGQPMPTNINW